MCKLSIGNRPSEPNYYGSGDGGLLPVLFGVQVPGSYGVKMGQTERRTMPSHALCGFSQQVSISAGAPYS